MTATIISIVNQKGGVGKTTTAINFATYLSEMNYRTLILDFDPQGNASSGIGIRADQIEKTIYDLITGNATVKEVLYPTIFKNLHIIPATNALAGAEVELTNQESRESLLKNKLSGLKNHYDFIVIDCAPSLGLLTINALVASEQALIPVQCEYFALEGIAHLMNTITLVQENLNPELEIAGIVLTMFDPRTSLNKLVIQDTRVYFKDLVFDTIIPRNVRLAEAPSHGLPIALYNPTSKGSISYLNLAKEYISRGNYG